LSTQILITHSIDQPLHPIDWVEKIFRNNL